MYKILSYAILLTMTFNVGASNYENDLYKIEQKYYKNQNNQNHKKQLLQAYNNYAFTLAKQRKYDKSIKYYRKALKLDNKNKIIKTNYSRTLYLKAKTIYDTYDQKSYTDVRFKDAKSYLQQATAIDPKNAYAWMLLGLIEYDNNELKNAKQHLQQAQSLLPNDRNIKAKLDKINNELEVSSGMQQGFNRYFKISYSKNLGYGTGSNISQMLTYAKLKVGSHLNYTQRFKIPVVVYSYEDYKNKINHGVTWSAGMYDGKIRIPIAPNATFQNRIKSIIVHEYTHAVIDDQTNRNCPGWLHEGLARYMEKLYGEIPKIVLNKDTSKIINTNKVNEMLRSPSGIIASLGYEYAYSFVSYLYRRYGSSKIKILLKELSSGTEFETAFQKSFYKSLVKVEKSWRLTLDT